MSERLRGANYGRPIEFVHRAPAEGEELAYVRGLVTKPASEAILRAGLMWLLSEYDKATDLNSANREGE